MAADDEFETVARFVTVAEAQSAATMLDGLGIETFVREEATAGVLPHMQIALGGVRVQVRREDAQRAKEALEGGMAEIEASDRPAELREEPEEVPAGDGGDERERNAHRAFRAAVVSFLFAPVAIYSLALLLDVKAGTGPLSDSARRRVWIALGLDLFVTGLLVAVIAFLWLF